MKKVFLGLAVMASLLIGCQDETNDKQEISQEVAVDMSDFYVKTDEVASKGTVSSKCYSMKVLNRQVKENPGLYKKMYNIEYATRKFLNSKKPDGTPGGGNGGNNGGGDGDVDVEPIDDGLSIDIPVYFHIVLPNASAVTNSQVQSQMNVINSDFTSPNTNQLPSGIRSY